jgi:hypothetical protein
MGELEKLFTSWKGRKTPTSLPTNQPTELLNQIAQLEQKINQIKG